MSERTDWTAVRRRRISRRTMLGLGARAGIGAAGLALVGCGGESDSSAARAEPGPPRTVGGHTVARQWNEELLTAIRGDFPAPTVHARNLFHLSVAMYDAWMVYDPAGLGYLVREKADIGGMSAAEVAAARDEAISFAAYRLLRSRFNEAVWTRAGVDGRLRSLGYDPSMTDTAGDSPSALGNRIAAAVIDHGLGDGANEQGRYADNSGYAPVNLPLPFKRAAEDGLVVPMTDPNRWQPLAFDSRITQNAIELGESVQDFIGPHWGAVTPFALRPAPGSDVSWSAVDPGPPPLLGGDSDAAFRAGVEVVLRLSSRTDAGVGQHDRPVALRQRQPPAGHARGPGLPRESHHRPALPPQRHAPGRLRPRDRGVLGRRPRLGDAARSLERAGQRSVGRPGAGETDRRPGPCPRRPGMGRQALPRAQRRRPRRGHRRLGREGLLRLRPPHLDHPLHGRAGAGVGARARPRSTRRA